MNTARTESWQGALSAGLAFRESTTSLASLSNEVMTPEQFFMPADRTAIAWTRERRLLLAVLEDAVSSFLRYRHSQTKRGRRLLREEEAWFTSTDQSWVFSFESICAHLNLDSDYLRRGLKRLRASEAIPLGEFRDDPALLNTFLNEARVGRSR